MGKSSSVRIFHEGISKHSYDQGISSRSAPRYSSMKVVSKWRGWPMQDAYSQQRIYRSNPSCGSMENSPFPPISSTAKRRRSTIRVHLRKMKAQSQHRPLPYTSRIHSSIVSRIPRNTSRFMSGSAHSRGSMLPIFATIRSIVRRSRSSSISSRGSLHTRSIDRGS